MSHIMVRVIDVRSRHFFGLIQAIAPPYQASRFPDPSVRPNTTNQKLTVLPHSHESCVGSACSKKTRSTVPRWYIGVL